MLYIPRGFGHGFITLTDSVETFCLSTRLLRPEAEGGLRLNDPAVRGDWPAELREMSDKDRRWPDLNPEFHGVELMRGLT